LDVISNIFLLMSWMLTNHSTIIWPYFLSRLYIRIVCCWCCWHTANDVTVSWKLF
jgi:hypothetical protein